MTPAEEHAWNLQAAVEEALQDAMGDDTGATARRIVERLTADGYLALFPPPQSEGWRDALIDLVAALDHMKVGAWGEKPVAAYDKALKAARAMISAASPPPSVPVRGWPIEAVERALTAYDEAYAEATAKGDDPEAAGMRAALQTTTTKGGPPREVIAGIIEPMAMAVNPTVGGYAFPDLGALREVALIKADAILALPPAPQSHGDLE